MKFTYYYKKADGIRREGTIEAPSRDDVFTVLRKDGIRPIKVVADASSAGGSVSTGIKHGVILGIGAGLLISVSSVVSYAFLRDRPQTGPAQASTRSENQEVMRVAKPRPRRWLEHRQDFAYDKIFSHPSEAFLARFAEPGFVPADKVPPFSEALKEDLLDCLADEILLSPSENESVAALKRIVSGLKSEVEMMLGSGMTVEEVIARFEERQKMEVEHRERILQDLSTGRITRDEASRNLARIGLRGLD